MFAYGLGSAGCSLVARHQVYPQLLVTNGSPDFDDRFRIWVILGDNQPYDYFEFVKSAFAPLNFPYGIPVEPDVPV